MLFSCGSITVHKPEASTQKKSSQKTITVAKNILSESFEIVTGKVRLITLDKLSVLEKLKVVCRGKEIPHFIDQGFLKFYLSENYYAGSGSFGCVVLSSGQKIRIVNINVRLGKYKQEKLNVDKKRVVLSPKDARRAVKEGKILKKIYSRSSKSPLFSTPFMIPLDSYVTSHYGTKRIYNDHKHSAHLGTDFRAKVGVPIRISNSGRVVFAGDLFFTGGTVIIDHGLNIFSFYGHLSKISVEAGVYLPKKALVGKSGKSGRVSGPHLHWGVKVNGKKIDGMSLVEARI
ncbi:MAG: M23 family metallopeptidase [Bacteriovoracaceae bacterium]|nr:M23 family metallopeptidase [Bacteriovoracaceae bacterium]